eukprot:753736-Amphidinium_carterae.1
MIRFGSSCSAAGVWNGVLSTVCIYAFALCWTNLARIEKLPGATCELCNNASMAAQVATISQTWGAHMA